MNSTSAFGYGFENMKARMTGLNGDFKIVPVLKGLQVHLSIDLQKEINKIATSI
jgi:signal transduction histidine kinase